MTTGDNNMNAFDDERTGIHKFLHSISAGRFDDLMYPVLRIFFGLNILTHGYPKLFGLPHGSNPDPAATLLNGITNVMQFPMPGVFAFLVIMLESFGALMIASGFQTRLVSFIFAVEMIGATYIHRANWSWTDRGMEMPVLMGVVALFIALRGSGAFSIDKRLGLAD